MPGRSSLDPRHRLARIFARCIKWATASQESAQICANVRRAQALVDSDLADVYMEPPMDCEKYKTSKIMYNENISWIYLIIGKYFWVLRVRFYFIRPKRMPKNRGSLPTSASFRSSVGAHAAYLLHAFAGCGPTAGSCWLCCATARTWLAAMCGVTGPA